MQKTIVLCKRLWKILPGTENKNFEIWKIKKYVGIGHWFYEEINPKLHEFVENAKSPAEIKEELVRLRPKQHKKAGGYGTPGNVANQLWQFYHEIEEGDSVIVYDKKPGHWLLGRISSKVIHNPYAKKDDEFEKIRKVKWLIPDNEERPENLFANTYLARTVVLDKDGTALRKLKSFLKKKGYTVKVRETGKPPRSEPSIKSEDIDSFKKFEATEGREYRVEATFRTRNAKLIIEKKKISDGNCEVCKMNFEERYGKIGRGYMVVHHKKAIGSRKVAAPTTLKDLAVVCANCHVMLHRTEPPMTLKQLRNRMK